MQLVFNTSLLLLILLLGKLFPQEYCYVYFISYVYVYVFSQLIAVLKSFGYVKKNWF